MPKPPPITRKPETPISAPPDGDAEPLSPISKSAPLAEILLFPNGKDAIPGVPEAETDPQTKARWLKLADEALEKQSSPKQA